MDERSRRKILDILRVLDESDRPLGGTRIAQALSLAGREMSQRTIRYYLERTDAEGYTEPVGRRGRQLTDQGRQELEQGGAVDKMGFIASKIESLTYRMTFKLRQNKGLVVVNLSTVEASRFKEAAKILDSVFSSGLGMGSRIKVVKPGGRFGKQKVGKDVFGIATICSFTLNGVFLDAGIPTQTVFGGLLQMIGHKPSRFTQIIYYGATTLDPLEIFIKGRMTSVGQAALTGNGVVGASFREIPAPSAEQARRLSSRMQKLGLGSLMLVGRPGQPLLEVPIHSGRVGVVVMGGLTPLAAVEEAGISTNNHAMGMLMPFEKLVTYKEALKPYI